MRNKFERTIKHVASSSRTWYNNYYTSISFPFIRIQFSMKRVIYRRVTSELFSALNFPSEWLDRRCRTWACVLIIYPPSSCRLCFSTWITGMHRGVGPSRHSQLRLASNSPWYCGGINKLSVDLVGWKCLLELPEYVVPLLVLLWTVPVGVFARPCALFPGLSALCVFIVAVSK